MPGMRSVFLEIKGPVSFWEFFLFPILEKFTELLQLTPIEAGP